MFFTEYYFSPWRDKVPSIRMLIDIETNTPKYDWFLRPISMVEEAKIQMNCASIKFNSFEEAIEDMKKVLSDYNKDNFNDIKSSICKSLYTTDMSCKKIRLTVVEPVGCDNGTLGCSFFIDQAHSSLGETILFFVDGTVPGYQRVKKFLDSINAEEVYK